MISIVALAKSEKKIDFPCYVWRPLIKAFLRYFFVHLLRSQLLFSLPRSQQFDGTAAISNCVRGFAAISASFFRSRDHSIFKKM